MIAQDASDHADGISVELSAMFLKDLIFAGAGFYFIDDVKPLAEKFRIWSSVVEKFSDGGDGCFADASLMEFDDLLHAEAKLYVVGDARVVPQIFFVGFHHLQNGITAIRQFGCDLRLAL